jgi:hypothetical protein
VPASGTTEPPTGPKFDPVNTTASPPDVDNDDPPEIDEIDGGAYDVVAVDKPLHCSPTRTSHRRPEPTPATVRHVTSLCSTDTLHTPDVYVVFSALTYRALTTLHGASPPRFDPPTRTTSPPAVDADVAPPKDVTTGAAYDVLPFTPDDQPLH